jgi:Xaa-Pro aminopeptidase
MAASSIDPKLFALNRDRLRRLLPPGSLAVLNANDLTPTTADGVLRLFPNSDLFYFSGVEQEESILVLFPDCPDENFREVLFLREPNELLKIWEGHKLSRAEATALSGIKSVRWLSQFESVFHGMMCDAERVFLNSNEHKRASIDVQTRDDRFSLRTREKYPLHEYHRLARLMHDLRVVKSEAELKLIREAVSITAAGFDRAARFVKPGVNEREIEAEFIHEFTRRGGRFAYTPIVASGANANVLHYIENNRGCRAGEMLLLDVGASYANYNADLTRTIPVSGKFTRRQRAVYEAVLRVMRAGIAGAVVGKLHAAWQKESQAMMTDELLGLGLIKRSDVKKQTPEQPAFRKYFMHGLGHPLGLAVHDVGFAHKPFAPGWVLTVEPGIYIPEEGFGVRLENDIVVTERGPVDLMADIPVEADDVVALMRKRPR